MKQNLKNNGNGANRLFSQLAAEKKKTICALCLIAVMVLMWARLLGKKKLEGAEAAVMSQGVNFKGESNSELKISFIELPKVKGRNDVLTRDFFASGGWQDFTKEGTKEVNVVSRDGSEEVVRRIAEKLKLEAIVLGENPQVFINDKLMSVGDKLLLRDEAKTYECEVAEIEENTVFIKCGEAEIQLKLMQAIEIEVAD